MVLKKNGSGDGRGGPRAILALAILALVTLAQAPRAATAGELATVGQSPVVIELFTSQGCSSCPPADRLVAALARRPGVFALTLPVDIWDYVGWKDTLATPHHTQRQRQYAKNRGDGRVYTPQASINGVAHVIGSNPEAIRKAAEECYGREGAMRVPVAATQTGATLRIDVGAAPAEAAGRAAVWLVRVASTRQVQVRRGENSGQTMEYVNVARSFERVGEWSGQPAAFEAALAPHRDADGWMVLLQTETQQRPGVILGAVKSPGL